MVRKVGGRGFGLPAGGVDVGHYCPFFWNVQNILSPNMKILYIRGIFTESFYIISPLNIYCAQPGRIILTNRYLDLERLQVIVHC